MRLRGGSRRKGLAARLGLADLGLALVVVVVVALMVVPLPTWLLDALLALNLAGSIAVLLAALYVGNALQISAFPTLLLVATLVRISLHVATTRLILLQADAGEVIRAFGQIVVAGNLVVGAVVFGILTIVQLVVVAKGSERVAEVGARFSLDALPGKQLAIDADLRAGTIDPEEAAQRRRALGRESQFYGAMDGAVKFVKGDVVATVLIALVNLVGGVAIGVGQRGLTLGASLELYGLLTIGDGLVTQIPALLMATAAGLLVTRVASEDPRTALGTELSTQLLAVPRALGVAGGLVLGLALVPGLPTVPFAVIGVGLLVVYRAAGRRGRAQRRADGADGADPHAGDGDDGRDGPAFIPVVVPWSLALGARVLTEVRRTEVGLAGLDGPTERLRRRIFREHGVPLPECRTARGTDVGDDEARLLIHELPAGTIPLSRDLSGADLVAALERGLLRLLTPRLPDFLGIAETKRLVDELEARAPALVRQVVPKVVDVTLLADVLRRLVDEGVSVRDLRAILEAIARSPAPAGGRDATALAEHARAELRRPLTYSLTGGSPELEVVVLDPGLEEAIRSAATRSAPGGTLHLSPAAARDIVGAIRRAIDDGVAPGPEGNRTQLATVILTRPEIRRFVKKLVETELPEVHVVASTELLPELTLRTRARASLVGL